MARRRRRRRENKVIGSCSPLHRRLAVAATTALFCSAFASIYVGLSFDPAENNSITRKDDEVTPRENTPKVETSKVGTKNANPGLEMPPESREVAFFVTSRRESWQVRDAIRESWALGHPDVFFVVGSCCQIPPEHRKPYTCTRERSSTPEEQSEWDAKCGEEDQRLDTEQTKYKDLLRMPDADVYRHQPHKLKFAYNWGVGQPQYKWFFKTDDDCYVRVSQMQTALTRVDTFMAEDPESDMTFNDFIIFGMVCEDCAIVRSGKWVDNEYNKTVRYPDFPLGFGITVNRPTAEWVAQHSDSLHNYHGDDVSLGIWLNDPSIKPRVKWIHSQRYTRKGDCMDFSMWVIAHDIPPEGLKKCANAERVAIEQAIRDWKAKHREQL